MQCNAMAGRKSVGGEGVGWSQCLVHGHVGQIELEDLLAAAHIGCANLNLHDGVATQYNALQRLARRREQLSLNASSSPFIAGLVPFQRTHGNAHKQPTRSRWGQLRTDAAHRVGHAHDRGCAVGATRHDTCLSKRPGRTRALSSTCSIAAG